MQYFQPKKYTHVAQVHHASLFCQLMVSWHRRLNYSQCNVSQTGFPPDGANLTGYRLAANQDNLCNSERNKLVCARVKGEVREWMMGQVLHACML